MRTVRAEFLTGYLQVANAVGLDGDRMLRDAGFGPEAMADPENRLPALEVIRLLETSAEISGAENFGLMMAEQRSFATLGPVSLLLERLANVREVVRMGIAYRQHFNDIVEVGLEQGEEVSVIRHDLIAGFWGTQTADLVNGVSYSTLVFASGGQWRPLAAHALRKAPKDLSAWRRMYGSHVEFESSFNGFSCTTASLLAPNPRADPMMVRHAERLLGLVRIDAGPEPVSELVRRSIGLLLPTGRSTLEHVATHMALSPRSLQRKLEAEGHQFGELLSDVRKDLAVAYLGSSDQPVTTVASLLGYSSPSSFTRWFTGAFGMTPQAWRAQRAAP